MRMRLPSEVSSRGKFMSKMGLVKEPREVYVTFSVKRKMFDGVMKVSGCINSGRFDSMPAEYMDMDEFRAEVNSRIDDAIESCK